MVPFGQIAQFSKSSKNKEKRINNKEIINWNISKVKESLSLVTEFK